MNISEIRAMSSSDLRSHLLKFRENLAKFILSSFGQQSVNTANFGVLKKNIARVLTVLNERGEKENA